MENDSKNLLMQYLYRFAEHYDIKNAPVSFKKRNELLDQLKNKNREAGVVIEHLIDAFIKADRIVHDKEKWEKARILWDAEHADAEREKVNAEMLLIQFCKTNSIRVGSVGVV